MPRRSTASARASCATRSPDRGADGFPPRRRSRPGPAPHGPGAVGPVAGHGLRPRRRWVSSIVPRSIRRTSTRLIHFQRGAALERLGRLDEAETELWTALQAAPDNADHPELPRLYVGRQRSPGRARGPRCWPAPTPPSPRTAISRTRSAGPSIGRVSTTSPSTPWRRPSTKEPANAEINDHLGDAYWQVGRQREAEWQWTRVLTLDPDAERRAEVEQKLAEGLTSRRRRYGHASTAVASRRRRRLSHAAADGVAPGQGQSVPARRAGGRRTAITRWPAWWPSPMSATW